MSSSSNHINKNLLPKTAAEAKHQGLKFFYPRKPCVHGHDSEYYVKGGCVVCVKEKALKGRAKQAAKRREKTQKSLAAIKRECARRICNNVFTPDKRKDQIFCSKRCSDIQGKEDWKKRNQKQFRKSENIRKKNKYHKDAEYKEKQVIRTRRNWDSKSIEEKFLLQQDRYKKEDPKVRRKRARLYQRKRNKEDINHRIAGSLRARIRQAIKNDGGEKSKRTNELIGCSIQQLKKYLEAQFLDGMNWDNYGKWHIDHIIPVTKFENIGTDIEQQKKCFHYSNMQPLWARDNLRKSNKVDK